MTFYINLLILLAACTGNAEWWVILVNRRHSIRARHQQLFKIRLLHNIGIVAFPVFIFWAAGFREGGLLRGGQFEDLPLTLQTLLLISITGNVPLFYSAVSWHCRKTTDRLARQSATHHDVAALFTDRAQDVRGDRSSPLLLFPANEIFQLEVNQKTLVPTRVSTRNEEKTRLRVAHFSDLHLIGCPGIEYHRFVFDQLADMQPDLFAFTGDLLDRFELLPQAEELFGRLTSVAPGVFVLGNHDWHLEHEKIRRALVATGWESLSGCWKRLQLGEHDVLIAGTEAPWMSDNPPVPPRAAEDLRLLLSHTPDQRNYALEKEFDVMLCGHNHGGQVVLPVIGPVYSPSIYGVRYAGGVFEHKDLLIHVSRGVGGKDPLRWNCPPEVTLLEFEFSVAPE